LNNQFKNDPLTSKLFEEYMPPYENVSSYVMRLCNEDDPVAIHKSFLTPEPAQQVISEL